MQQDIGVYRLHSTGPILEGYFDWTTGRIGPYKANPEYGYIEEYHHDLAELPMRVFYKLLAEDERIVAAISINKTYVACLFEGGTVYYYYFDDKLFHLSATRWEYAENIDVVPIGYMKTRYKCQSVFLMPAKLLYSPSRRSVFLNRTWIPIHEEPLISEDIPTSLYTELIRQDKEYVYFNKGGEPVWRDS